MNESELVRNKFKINIDYTPTGQIAQVLREDITGLVFINIAGDKHAYACMKCGAIFQSKNMYTRNLFDTNDPKNTTCNNAGHTYEDLIKVCECETIV